jgi:pimeloyl-ACP methyl ester carboxylesterase
MAAELAHPEVTTVPEAGHAAHLEEPARVAEIIAGDAERWLKVSGNDPMTAA